MKITVVGAGTAGVMAAAYLKKKLNADVYLLYSNSVPTIGVGESVTPYVTRFLNDLELDEQQWMQKTNSIYKYGNCFEDWTDDNLKHFFAFTYNEPVDKVLQNKTLSWDDIKCVTSNDIRSTDVWTSLYCNGESTYFSDDFNQLHCFMEDLKAPYMYNRYLGTPYSYAYHIDAEALGEYLKTVCKDLGVKEIVGTITKTNINNGIKSVELDTGEIVTSDVWIDASGFHRVLIGQLTNEFVHYDTPGNASWVAPLEYTNDTQMKNYTQSIWNKYGWIFKIGLTNRQGCGLVFDTRYTDPEDAKQEFLKQAENRNIKEPRLITWEPKRYKTPAVQNTFAIGMSAGFVEPMEANALYITIATIKGVERALNNNNIDEYNRRVGFTIDDIADFIDVHYTLCNKGSSEFWNAQRQRGIEQNHVDMLLKKYNSKYHNIGHAVEYWTMFPDYMWLELAAGWTKNIDKFKKDIPAETIKKFKEIVDIRKLQMHNVMKNAQDYKQFITEFHNV